MWLAMTLAMMLPASGPMITVYADIAQTARNKGMTTISPAVLTAGYLSVWAVFCLAAALLQSVLTQFALLDNALIIRHPAIAGGVLTAAGCYQLSPFRQACLVRCRTPLPLFLARWSPRASGVFKMGVIQGASCLTCCWALMLVMFAAGLMNLVWMAIVAIILLLEKTLPDPSKLTQLTGFALLAWAIAVFAVAWG